jgi:ABC-type transport system involved in cytochrome c biogenesis permease component
MKSYIYGIIAILLINIVYVLIDYNPDFYTHIAVALLVGTWAAVLDDE